MEMLVLDPIEQGRLLEEREATGADRYDEVWEGVYVVCPLPNDEHQEVVTRLSGAFLMALGWAGPAQVRAGVNVSDREEDWEHNYRGPDVVVFLADTAARNLGTHWVGGPDFAVEVVSPHDRSREKRSFYARVGTRELLIVDRYPWALELYRLRDGDLVPVGASSPEQSLALASEVVPLSFRLVSGEPRPRIEVVHTDGARHWLI
jgi:Uma2 family endonuclease